MDKICSHPMYDQMVSHDELKPENVVSTLKVKFNYNSRYCGRSDDGLC